MSEHKESGKINANAPYFEWMAAVASTPYSEVRDHEKLSIAKYNPRKNKNDGGGGRDPKKLVYGAKEVGRSISQSITGIEYEEFLDSHGDTYFGVANDRFYLVTIRFALSRFIRFVFKIMLLLVVLALVLNHFGIIDITELIQKLPLPF